MALLLVLLALSVRLFVPQGYMLTPQADGVIRISLCSGQGAVEVGLTPDGRVVDLPEGDAPGSDEPPCPFALALAPAFDPPPPMLAGPVVLAETQMSVTAAHQRPGLGLVAPPPPSRGPPPLLT